AGAIWQIGHRRRQSMTPVVQADNRERLIGRRVEGRHLRTRNSNGRVLRRAYSPDGATTSSTPGPFRISQLPLSGYETFTGKPVVDKTSRRTAWSPRLINWRAPDGPSGKHTRSETSSGSSLPGWRSVGAPASTSTHSSRPQT